MQFTVASPTARLKFHGSNGSSMTSHPKLSPPLTTAAQCSKSSSYRPVRSMALNTRCLGAVITIERPKPKLSPNKYPPLSKIPMVDIGGDGGFGGGGGGIGRGGGGMDGDDDSYWPENDDEAGDDEEELFGFFSIFKSRSFVEEIFDRDCIEAVLSEWMKTAAALPLGLRQSCEMGLVSSAEVARYLSHNLRPTVFRALARSLSLGFSTNLNAKVMADPAFLWKVLWEVCSSVAWSVWLHAPTQEQPYRSMITNAALNAAQSAFVVMSLAPSAQLVCSSPIPSNVFHKSPRFRDFSPESRLLSFFHKAVLFFAIGFATKAVSTPGIKKEQVSGAVAAGLSMGLLTNLRYQLMVAADRIMDQHFDSINVSLAFCFALRFLNVGVGTLSPNWITSSSHELDLMRMFIRAEPAKKITPVVTKRKRVIRKKREKHHSS